MTESADETQRPVSVAELLARNGAGEGNKISGHRRRMRGNSDAIPVAELTGEIPVIRDRKGGKSRPNPAPAPAPPVATPPPTPEAPSGRSYLQSTAPALFGGDSMADEVARQGTGTPASSPIRSIFPPTPAPAARPGEPRKSIDFNDATGVIEPVTGGPVDSSAPPPETLETPAPAPVTPPAERVQPPAPAESPEPEVSGEVHESQPEAGESTESGVEHGHDTVVDEEASVDEESGDEASAEDGEEAVAEDAVDLAAGHDIEEPDTSDEATESAPLSLSKLADDADTTTTEAAGESGESGERTRLKTYLHGAWIAGQYLLAAAAGAGLFLVFRVLWGWNMGIAFVLGLLLVLIFVASLWVLRKTVDLVSILIAILVGALIAFGPLVLMLQENN
jgi:hypothetical protein